MFGVLPSFEGSLTKLGVGADGIKTTPLSGEPDLLKGPSPEADALIERDGEWEMVGAPVLPAQTRGSP